MCHHAIHYATLGTMTHRPKLVSVGIQCDLLAVPPLWKLVRGDDVPTEAIAEPITSDPEDTDLDTSFQIIQEDITTE